MILTGKSKEDFERWNNDIYGIVDTAHSNECIEFRHLNPELQHSVIIDWFDSVGIRITVSYWDYTSKWQDVILGLINGSYEHNSRHEATKQAIIKANDIYNETIQTTSHQPSKQIRR